MDPLYMKAYSRFSLLHMMDSGRQAALADYEASLESARVEIVNALRLVRNASVCIALATVLHRS